MGNVTGSSFVLHVVIVSFFFPPVYLHLPTLADMWRDSVPVIRLSFGLCYIVYF